MPEKKGLYKFTNREVRLYQNQSGANKGKKNIATRKKMGGVKEPRQN